MSEEFPQYDESEWIDSAALQPKHRRAPFGRPPRVDPRATAYTEAYLTPPQNDTTQS